MEEDIDSLRSRLSGQMSSSCYPTERAAIRDRYTDTSYYIFKTSQPSYRGSFLSFGSRRSSMLSSYGNTPTVIRRSFSSSGMLEYTLEQMGAHRLMDNHVLPSITKEEETDDLEGCGRIAEPISTGKFDPDKVEPTADGNPMENQKEGAGSQGQDKDISCADQNDLTVEDDSSLSTKNPKFFHHYDMPPVRKSSLPKRKQGEENLSSVSNGFLLEEGMQSVPDAPLQSEDEIKRQEKSLNLNEEPINAGVKQDHLIIPTQQSQVTSNVLKVDLSSSSILPRISAATSQDESPSTPKATSLLNEEDHISQNESNTFSLPHTSDTLQLERAASVNEKTSANFVPRKSGNRFSLRDFPLRSPTPPKKSPWKTTKKEKEVSAKGPKSPITPLNKPQKLPVSTSKTIPSASLPPLISASNSDVEIGHVNDDVCSPTSLIDSKPLISVHRLDETPLFIVEDEYDNPSTVSPRIGIPSLVSDGKLSKSFIVVHPTSDSNSLGLAPLPESAQSSSVRKRGPSSIIEPCTTSPHSSGPTNGSNMSLHAYPSLSNYSSTSRIHEERLRSVSSASTTGAKHSKSSGGSFFSVKRPSQVKLLRFTKSYEEGGLSPTFVSPLSTKTPMFLTNYQATKGQIRSFPLDTSYEKGLILNFPESFVNTNASRMCSIM